MQLLNLACNGCRLPEPFVNVDILRTQLHPGTPERINLDKESNYVEHDLLNGIPFPDGSCEGILISHFIEHLDAKQAVSLIADSKRVLVDGGMLVASVPDASYFREHYHEDNRQNTVRLFGEPIPDAEVENKFFDYALFQHEHKQVLTEDSLWALLVKGGFTCVRPDAKTCGIVTKLLTDALNRHKFSTILWTYK